MHHTLPKFMDEFNWLIAKMKKLVVNLYKTPKSLSLLVLALLCWMNSNFERYLFSSVSHIERFFLLQEQKNIPPY